MSRSLVPARRRILHLAEGIARSYEAADGSFSMRRLCADLWLATEMQTLTPDLGLKIAAIEAMGSSVRGSRRRVQDIRPISIPVRLDREFARLAREHGVTPSVAVAFVMAWRAQHTPSPAA